MNELAKYHRNINPREECTPIYSQRLQPYTTLFKGKPSLISNTKDKKEKFKNLGEKKKA